MKGALLLPAIIFHIVFWECLYYLKDVCILGMFVWVGLPSWPRGL